MNESEREAKLDQWRRPSCDDEVDQQERALRMVNEAIEGSRLADAGKRVYAKGSYANNTNVRRDSDVDIAVDCHECMYYDSPNVIPAVSLSRYSGEWTYSAWRQAVVAALEAKFPGAVDTSRSVAIHIPEVPGSRPNIDVVPGFHYRRYTTADASAWPDGTKVFPKQGEAIINWPAQQLAKGRHKNDLTGRRYKDFVRVLKNAENQCAKRGDFDEKPSFLMECLVYNVANPTLMTGSLSQGFRATLQELWSGLNHEQIWKQWLEPSRLKWALVPPKKWTVEDARQVVQGAWDLLEYA